jgi:coenzyme F420-reducing hydrogenase gamma subunit
VSRAKILDAPATAGPKLAVWKFASCDGCQLSLLDCERQLLALADRLTIASFPEVTSAVLDGPYDLSLVEGSISVPGDVERIERIREQSTVLVTIGACATAGGIQALRNGVDVEEFSSIVYAEPQYIATLATSTAISDHVDVDFELRGCPIDRGQLVEVVTAYLDGRPARISSESVCTECKARSLPCVMVARQMPCLGPVTHAGCGALCPGFDRGCYGCFGPAETAHTESLDRYLSEIGVDALARERLWRGFSGWSPEFRRVVSAGRVAGDGAVAREVGGDRP